MTTFKVVHSPVVADDPIRFQAADEFRNRPNFFAPLDGDGHELEQILGGYAFAKVDELQCGLKSCRKWHQHGFVIKLRGGTETNVGQDCARKHFHANWDELYQEFKVADDARKLRDFVASVMASRDSFIAQASATHANLQRYQPLVAAVRADLLREWPVARAALDVARAGGAVKVGRRIEEDSYAASSGQAANERYFLETVGTVAKIDVLGLPAAQPPGIELAAKLRVAIGTLKSIDAAALPKLGSRQLKALVSQLDDAQQVISAAAQHVANIEEFLPAANLQPFGSMEVHRTNTRGRRILRWFAEGYQHVQSAA